MRCGQCGFESAQGAAFCARCGARLSAPRPDEVREYALVRILPSWWHFTGHLIIVILFFGGGLFLVISKTQTRAGLLLIALAAAVLGMTSIARRYTTWSLTSDRLIERRGVLASHRREMELADVRSIEVDRSLTQRIIGLGDVMIASAASSDFLIRLTDIPDPEHVAEMLRRARLKRLA
jgi:uncharacterized membrane protein YdbT with pleckstrin-like domain